MINHVRERSNKNKLCNVFYPTLVHTHTHIAVPRVDMCGGQERGLQARGSQPVLMWGIVWVTSMLDEVLLFLSTPDFAIIIL